MRIIIFFTCSSLTNTSTFYFSEEKRKKHNRRRILNPMPEVEQRVLLSKVDMEGIRICMMIRIKGAMKRLMMIRLTLLRSLLIVSF